MVLDHKANKKNSQPCVVTCFSNITFSALFMQYELLEPVVVFTYLVLLFCIHAIKSGLCSKSEF